MDKLLSTDSDSNNNYIIDEMDTTSLTNLQHSDDMNVNDNADGSVKDNALAGANPGYSDTQNALDETETDLNKTILDSSSSTTPLEQDYDSGDSLNDDQQQQDNEDALLEKSDDDTLDNSTSGDIQQKSDVDVDDDDDDTETTEQDGMMEQGAMEENDIDDSVGSTLEVLVENGEQATTTLYPLVNSSMIDHHHLSPQYNASSTMTSKTIGYDMDDFAMIDFSYWLYGAIFILICLRLPYFKRYFTRRNHQDIDSNATLPYHTIQNKELD